jgi:hypothetical protein
MQHHRRRRQRAGALAIVALCVQYSALLMALPEDKEKAHWNELETSALVDYFYEHRSEVGEGGNFSAETYDAAAEHISLHLSQGPKKTGKMCETKWASVCYHRRAFTHTN